ncbi:MAG: LysR substrate-binding domain-containing protein, partial [Betaproteobacteria bacterium]
MDLASLRIFRSVVDQGGINKAAAKLNRVPSNVTTRIKQLEAQLGAALFLRVGRRLALSSEGKLLLTYADRLLRLSAEAEAAMRDGKPRGTLRIGALESTAGSRLPPVLSRYHALYPDVQIELVTGTSGALVSRVHQQDVEAAFVAEPFNAEGLATHTVFVEELVLITPKSFGPIRSPKDIENRTVIAFPAGCSYRRRLEAWLGAGSVLADRVLEFQSYHAIVACVAAGSGIAVVPRALLPLTNAGDNLTMT